MYGILVNCQGKAWGAMVLITCVVRLIMMALPSNDWGAAVPPQPMSLYRNIPLMVQGVGIVALFLLSAYRNHDTTFKWIGWMK